MSDLDYYIPTNVLIYKGPLV